MPLTGPPWSVRRLPFRRARHPWPLPRSLRQRLVRPVAERALRTVFATAEIDRTLFFRGVRHRGKSSAFVRPVTKRLRLALSAGTPVIRLAGFHRDGHRRSLGDFGCVHREPCPQHPRHASGKPATRRHPGTPEPRRSDFHHRHQTTIATEPWLSTPGPMAFPLPSPGSPIKRPKPQRFRDQRGGLRSRHRRNQSATHRP
jgi:hypothetical protein